MEITTSSAENTKEFARKFAGQLEASTTIALYGGLGTGKTTFIQGLGEALGIKKRILSPTFVFLRSYSINKGRLKKFHHIDLYRLDRKENVESIGLKEILEDKDALVAIEWPEKVENLLPKNVVKIRLEAVADGKRRITYPQPKSRGFRRSLAPRVARLENNN